MRMLFIDYSSTFNIIVPSKIFTKIKTLGLNTSLCNWILDFLMGCTHVVRVGNSTSSMLTLKTGAPQRCVHNPLLYSLFTHDYVVAHNTIIKFADDMTVVGLITDDDETAYREVRDLTVWCQDNNLFLNVSKTKALIVDYTKGTAEHAPIHIDRAIVEQV